MYFSCNLEKRKTVLLERFVTAWSVTAVQTAIFLTETTHNKLMLVYFAKVLAEIQRSFLFPPTAIQTRGSWKSALAAKEQTYSKVQWFQIKNVMLKNSNVGSLNICVHKRVRTEISLVELKPKQPLRVQTSEDQKKDLAAATRVIWGQQKLQRPLHVSAFTL